MLLHALLWSGMYVAFSAMVVWPLLALYYKRTYSDDEQKGSMAQLEAMFWIIIVCAWLLETGANVLEALRDEVLQSIRWFFSGLSSMLRHAFQSTSGPNTAAPSVDAPASTLTTTSSLSE